MKLVILLYLPFALILAAFIIAMLENCDFCYDELNDDLPVHDREFIKWVRSLKGKE